MLLVLLRKSVNIISIIIIGLIIIIGIFSGICSIGSIGCIKGVVHGGLNEGVSTGNGRGRVVRKGIW